MAVLSSILKKWFYFASNVFFPPYNAIALAVALKIGNCNDKVGPRSPKVSNEMWLPWRKAIINVIVCESESSRSDQFSVSGHILPPSSSSYSSSSAALIIMELVLEAELALEAVATIAQFDWHLNYGSVLSFSEIGLSSKLQFCHSESWWEVPGPPAIFATSAI